MKKLTALLILMLVVATAACGGGKKKAMPFWLLLGAMAGGNADGGNQGTPATDSSSDAPGDPPPTVTAQGTDQTCAAVSPPPSPSVADVLNQQALTGDGTSTSPDIFVEKGVIVGNLTCGKLTRETGAKAQVVLNGALNGTATVKDVSGTVVNGQWMIIADDFVFLPVDRLLPSKVYTITFVITGGSTFTENIFMAVDNTCMANSLFDQATVYGADANPVIKDSALVDNLGATRSIMGWDFSKGRFYMTLQNKTAGAKYVLTLFGVYDIAGHSCEVYFQRFASSPYNAVENIDITNSGRMLVDETDASIPNPAGGNYSFSKTYIQMKVYDAANNDITATDPATMKLEITQQKVAMAQTSKALAAAPKFSAPEQSQGLLASIGRSPRNMAVVGLILLIALGGLVVVFYQRRKNPSH